METQERTAEATAVDLARECVYRFLSLASADPWLGACQLLYDPKNQRLAAEAAALLREETGANLRPWEE